MRPSAEDLIAEGYAARKMGHPGNALAAFTQAEQVSLAAGRSMLRAHAITGMGQINRDLGNLDSAFRHYQSAVDLLRTLDDALLLAHTIRHVGDILQDQGELSAAVSLLSGSIADIPRTQGYAAAASCKHAQRLRSSARRTGKPCNGRPVMAASPCPLRAGRRGRWRP